MAKLSGGFKRFVVSILASSALIAATELWPGEKTLLVRRNDGTVKAKVPLRSLHDKREYDPAHSWAPAYRPSPEWLRDHRYHAKYCNIQDTECYKNTRVRHFSDTRGLETWSYFKQNHTFDNNQQISYGCCYAFIDEAPEMKDLVHDCDCATFFWNHNGDHRGDFGCIQDPQDAKCGCEESTGRFKWGHEWACTPKEYPNGNGDHMPSLEEGERWVYKNYDQYRHTDDTKQPPGQISRSSR